MSPFVQNTLVAVAVAVAAVYLLRQGWKLVRLFRGGSAGGCGGGGGCGTSSRPRKQKVQLEPTRKLER